MAFGNCGPLAQIQLNAQKDLENMRDAPGVGLNDGLSDWRKRLRPFISSLLKGAEERTNAYVELSDGAWMQLPTH